MKDADTLELTAKPNMLTFLAYVEQGNMYNHLMVPWYINLDVHLHLFLMKYMMQFLDKNDGWNFVD